jgi:hypothetical protein
MILLQVKYLPEQAFYLTHVYLNVGQKVTGQKVTDEKSQDKKSQFKFCILTKHIGQKVTV